MTLQKVLFGKELGVERRYSIVTDEATLSKQDFLRAATAVAQTGILGASKSFTGPLGPLSSHLLPKMPVWAIPGVSI